MRYVCLILLGYVLMTTSCTTTKPYYSKITENDYNGRRTISGPYLEKKINAIGVASSVGMAAAGAYIGYENTPSTTIEGGAIKNNQYLGAAIGAVVGYGISSLANHIIFKQGNRKTVNVFSDIDKKEWLTRSSLNARIVSGTNSFLIIEENAPDYYTIKSSTDISDYKNSFGNYNINPIAKKSVEFVDRNNIPLLINSFDLSEKLNKGYKKKYGLMSSNFYEFAESVKRYPDVKDFLEKSGVSKIKKYSDFESYTNLYTNAKYRKEGFVNSFNTQYGPSDISEAKILLKKKVKLPEVFVQSQKDNIRQNYFDFMVKYENDKNLSDLNKTMYGLRWVQAPDMSEVFINQAWYIGTNFYKSGNKFLKNLALASNHKNFKYLNINKERLKVLNKYHLSKVVETQIVSDDITVTDPKKDGDFDNWKSSFFYDAPYVNQLGERKFLVRGYITNNSSFDLPVTINSAGNLIMEMDAEFLNIKMSSIYAFFGQKDANKVVAGTQNKQFYYPKVKANSTLPFAILYDFGEGSLSQGINFMGAQAYYEVYMVDPKITFSLLNEKVDKSTINIQKYWMTITENDMPQAKLKELFGNDYDPDNYVIEFPDADYYKDTYGSDCGCSINSIKDEGWFFKNNYDTVTFENGSSADVKYESGKWQVIGWIFNDKYNSYHSMITDLKVKCMNNYCN